MCNVEKICAALNINAWDACDKYCTALNTGGPSSLFQAFKHSNPTLLSTIMRVCMENLYTCTSNFKTELKLSSKLTILVFL